MSEPFIQLDAVGRHTITAFYGSTTPDGTTAPWNAVPVGSLYFCQLAGSISVWQRVANAGLATDWVTNVSAVAITASHAAVTLATDADTLLGLTGQAISLDAQTANYVLAGPTTGAAADPTFRALVSDDVPTLDHGAKLTGLSDDDHTQYLLATGTRDGATSAAQQFVIGSRHGDDANHSDFDSTGHLTMAGTAMPWEDILPYSVNPGTGLTGLDIEDYGTTGFRLYYWANNTSASEVYQAFFQIPHRMLQGGDAHLHLHVIPSANGSAGNEDVELKLDYQWVNIGGAYSTTTNATDTDVFRVGAADANKHILWEFDPPLDGDGKTLSADLMVKVTRLTKSAERVNDDYTGKVYLRFIDLHMQQDALGSTDETTK